jgi:SMI1 / KNR4 family (SUKH-1)
MVSIIKDIKDLKWYRPKNPLKEENLILLKGLPFTLPKTFIELLKISDGGRLEYDFYYYDVAFKDIVGSGISVLYGIEKDDYGYDLITSYQRPPAFFPQGLVPLGAGGNSNRICFDYRADPKTNNPPVVFWNFGSNEGEDVSFLANNFDEFLIILKEPDDDEA